MSTSNILKFLSSKVLVASKPWYESYSEGGVDGFDPGEGSTDCIYNGALICEGKEISIIFEKACN